jgi:hypothetical protein
MRALRVLLVIVASCGSSPPAQSAAPVASTTPSKPSRDPCRAAIASVLGHAPITIRLLSDKNASDYDAWLRALAAESPTVTYRWIALGAEDARDYAKIVGLEGNGVVLETGVDREIALLSPEAIEQAARTLVHAPPGDECRGAVVAPSASTSSPGPLDFHSEPLVAADLYARATSLRIDDVTLVRDGASWKVSPSNVPADEANVRKAFEALAETKLREAIAPDASLLLSKHIVVMAGSETLLDVTVGRSGHRGTALRLAGAPQARVAGAFSDWVFRREPRMWRERKIWELDTNDVRRVEITNGRTSLVMTKHATQWQATLDGRPVTLAPSRIEGMLNAYRHPYAEDLPTDADVGKDAGTIRFTMARGPARVMHVGAKRADGTFPARVDGDSTVYAIPSYTAGFVADPAVWRTP